MRPIEMKTLGAQFHGGTSELQCPDEGRYKGHGLQPETILKLQA